MDSMRTVVTLVCILVALAAAVCLLALGAHREARADQRRRDERRRILDEVLRPLAFDCDGRSLIISTTSPWPADDSVTVRCAVRLRQVFRFDSPGLTPVEIMNVVDEGDLALTRIGLPDQLGESVTDDPLVLRPMTAQDMREEHLARLAVRLNLDQHRIDATTVELVDHQISYVLEYDNQRFATTGWVSYRPAESIDADLADRDLEERP